jgi:hypothetical protein
VAATLAGPRRSATAFTVSIRRRTPIVTSITSPERTDLDGFTRSYTVDGNTLVTAGNNGIADVKSGFGEEKYERLVALKDTWDPTNVFRSNHNIPPSGWTPEARVPGQSRS